MKKVLVVDDSPTVRTQVAAALSEGGYQILEAGDGVDGIALVEAHPDVGVVICDVNMPRMNGLEMVESLKREGRHATLPILMLTSEGQPTFIERARKAGAKGWIVKPFKANLLLAAVSRLLGESVTP